MIDFNRREAPVDNDLGINVVTAELTEEIARLNAWILRLGHAHRNQELRQELRRRIEIEREMDRIVSREP